MKFVLCVRVWGNDIYRVIKSQLSPDRFVVEDARAISLFAMSNEMLPQLARRCGANAAPVVRDAIGSLCYRIEF